jgi:hypothetical protein
MNRSCFLVIFILSTFIAKAQYVNLAQVLNEQILYDEIFENKILPYINFDKKSSVKINPKSYVLDRDMNFYQIIDRYGAKGMDVQNLSLLTHNLVAGNLQNIKLSKNTPNVFIVLVKNKPYFVDLTWMEEGFWYLGALNALETTLGKEVHLFTSY